MIDGMSEICIDCIHQEVCRYDCHRPSEHCNDRAVADDFIPQGKWIDHCYQNFRCSICGYIIADSDVDEYNYCPNCGAQMQKGGTE